MNAAKFGRTSIAILQGDITEQHVDVIVNAANSGLRGGGGVDGAIHRAGGPSIMAECDRIRAEQGGCPTGRAVVTSAGKLHAKYVIHAVGPIWGEYDPPECDSLLVAAYSCCLTIAHEREVRTIAFPSISTGVYGFPIERAAPIVLSTVRGFIANHHATFDEIHFVLFSDSDRIVYETAFAALASRRD